MSLTYLARRVGEALLTIFVVLVLNFFLFRILPGDPARAGVQDPRMSAEAVESIRARFGLDQPVVNGIQSLQPLELGAWTTNPFETQFGLYLRNLAIGDLGISYHSGEPVSSLLRERLGNTLLLILGGQLLAILLGVGWGSLAAARAGKRVDHVAVLSGLITWSLPSFWLAMILLFLGSQLFGLPLGGRATPGLEGGLFVHVADIARHLILPTLTLAVVYFGEFLLVSRSTLIDELGNDYVLVARAKGLDRRAVMWRHALRGAALPIATLIALNLGMTVAGSLQVEMVFSWPGLGLAMYEAVVRRDYPVLQGVFLMLTISVVLANTLVELLYPVLDPRTKK